MSLPLAHTLTIFLLLLSLTSCAPLQQRAATLTQSNDVPLPTHPLYVLAGNIGSTEKHELVIVDADTWQIVRRTPLPNIPPSHFSRDPQGRIWIGNGGAAGRVGRYVQVFAPDGRLLKTLSPCTDPYLAIHFAAGRAFIPCSENGFSASAAVVDLASFEMIKKVDVRINDDIFLLVASGGDENYFALAGNGNVTNRVVLVDTHTLTALDSIPTLPSAPRTTVAHNERLILLNSIAESLIRNGMVESLSTGRPDLLIIDTKPEPVLSTYQMVAPGALWGVIEGDNLYIYHNAEQLGFNADSFRAVSRFNLVTNETELWQLPADWSAGDIALVDDEIILAHSDFVQPKNAGLYRFDPATSELEMLVNIPGAARIIPPAE